MDLLISALFILVAITVLCVATLVFRGTLLVGGILYREVKHSIKHGHRPFGVQ